MDLIKIFDIIVFMAVLLSILTTLWTYLIKTKEEMQARLFLRYEYVKKSTITFFLAVALYVIVHSLDEIGIHIPPFYYGFFDGVILVLVIMSLYYFISRIAKDK
ncbi:MAG: hypothetical protein FJ150_09580 [Euryarchaeota archaeon]|nr:hypothetical protein [Euryarchaeota archaeon]